MLMVAHLEGKVEGLGGEIPDHIGQVATPEGGKALLRRYAGEAVANACVAGDLACSQKGRSSHKWLVWIWLLDTALAISSVQGAHNSPSRGLDGICKWRSAGVLFNAIMTSRTVDQACPCCSVTSLSPDPQISAGTIVRI